MSKFKVKKNTIECIDAAYVVYHEGYLIRFVDSLQEAHDRIDEFCQRKGIKTGIGIEVEQDEVIQRRNAVYPAKTIEEVSQTAEQLGRSGS